MKSRRWSIFLHFGQCCHPPPCLHASMRSQPLSITVGAGLRPPQQAAQEPAEERKHKNDATLEGGTNGWMDEWVEVGGSSPRGLWRKCLYQSLDGGRRLF